MTDGEFDERLRAWIGLRLAVLFAAVFFGTAAGMFAFGIRWSVLGP